MSLASFLRTVVDILDEAGVPYMLTGSLASAYYATPRATQDIDVVIETDEPGLDRIVQGLLEWSRLGDSALQRRDVDQLLERTWLRLDLGYVEEWIETLGLQSEWAAALSRRRAGSERDD